MRFAGLDVETAGTKPEYALQPFRALKGEAWLTSIAYAVAPQDLQPLHNEDQILTLPERAPTVDSIRAFLNFCIEKNLTITGWNLVFDVSWLIALGLREEVMRCKWLDGMLLLKHNRICPTFETTRETPGYGLKQAVADFLPQHAGYQVGVDFDAQSEAGIQQLMEYNARDTRYSLMITAHLWYLLTPQQQRVALCEASSIPLVAETMVRGVCADLGTAQKLSLELDAEATLALVTLKLGNPEITPEILRSPKQLSELLFNKWKLAPHKTTSKGALSTDRETLTALALVDPRAKLLNDYRENNGNKTKFADGTVESLTYNGDGCVRPAHRIFGTYTGRMSISSTQGRGKAEVQTGIALHQWKREARFRRLLTPPEGFTLCEFDFAGQEFRWMAEISGDPIMRKLCVPGEDAHSYMAAQIMAYNYADFMRDLKAKTPGMKEKRQLGKVANLSLQYRTSAMKLMQVAAVQHNIQIGFDEAKLIHATYQRTYSAVPRYWKAQKHWVRNNNFVENLAGRRVWLRMPGDRSSSDSWSYDSTAVNYPIQSMGAEQKYLALAVVKKLSPKFGGFFYYELHDGLFVVIPDSQVADAVPVIQYALSNLPYKRAFNLDLSVSFPVDAKVGKSWGDLQEWVP